MVYLNPWLPVTLYTTVCMMLSGSRTDQEPNTSPLGSFTSTRLWKLLVAGSATSYANSYGMMGCREDEEGEEKEGENWEEEEGEMEGEN
ncbi:hypothetical protein Pmani_026560 [Petrolisthes manimaculis]|uniref:Uncharacterized protein n=1 Tax=Petrolisthes manimaculis TaxID=1843537 RepID=A0AAE1P5S9_9EUCA|nr:hypothetical protein Pmani_026560 [Petrolisthes manimaculis]